jgi:signal transduction histidine kinase/ligand-binding sensor domain-containing protein/DNA-binding response OmpR family regulator
MMMIRLKKLIALLLVLICARAYSQQILFRNYSVINGLCSNTVWNITQDDRGYMWFGTKNGLNRFDGYQFKSYQAGKGEQSLGNNFIHAICRFDSKTFWIGTAAGVYVFDLETEKFTLLEAMGRRSVFEILKDRNGMVWMGTRGSGLYRYNPANKQLRQFGAGPNTTNTVSVNQIRKLIEDNDGNIWIGTFGGGIDVLDPKTLTFRHYKAGNKEGDLSSNQILTLYKDLQGNIWAGTLSGGLNMWSKTTHQFKTYKAGGSNSLSDNIVRTIFQPSPDKVYIGTEKGLNILDIPTQRFTGYTNKSNDPFSISDNAVYAIHPDKEGGIWVGTYFGGVNYFPGKGSNFELYYATGESNSLSGNAVSSFLEDKPGYFWIGTENAGLNYFDAHNKTFKHFPFTSSQQSLSYHNIHALFKDKKGRIWIGTFTGGLNIYDPQTGAVKTYKHDPADTTSLSNNSIYTIYEDKQGVIWVGTVDGLNIYDPQKDAFIRVHEMNLQHNCIYAVYEDDFNNIWIATYDSGLIGKNRKTNNWMRFSPSNKPGSISSNRIISLLDDHEGNLWLGTDGGGLNCFNIKSKTFKVFKEQQGISAIVFGLLQDNNGDLWLSTNEGIIKFSPGPQKSRLFTNWDNLQSKQFNYKAYLKASDGKFYFGGVHGFNAFSPDNIHDTVLKSYITLTNFQLFNKDVAIDKEESPLSKLIGFERSVTLHHDQSVLSFEYAALSYLAPEKIQYAYKMEGFDDNWNYVGTQRKATYTNLPPGKYVFKVKSTDNAGNWNETTADISVIVKPPFYKSTLAYIFYAILLIAAIIGFRNFSIRQARKKNEANLERLKVQREKEFYNQKIEFFTTMAHEIRTPLSLIIAPLEKLMGAGEWKPEVKEQLEIMDQNSDRLLKLVNQLLDFRRIESDIYTIRTEEMELISFIHSVYSRFSAISYQKGIRFTMVTNINRLVVHADPEALVKILNNLLINAFKFTRSKVEISINEPVTDEQGQQFFSISVEDDGIGIPAGQLDNIFKAFFKLPSEPQHNNLGGTGIGLALAKSLTEKHGGNLEVESREGVKTIFTVLIPYEAKEAGAVVSETSPAAEPNGQAEDQQVILVVEDDLSLLEFISKSLKSEGYNYLCAANGKEALKLLETNAVELIVSDVMMPEMDGIEFCRQVKDNINYSHIPLVLLTAKGNTDAEISGIESGADAYITKPFKWKHVAVVIKNLLESRARLKNKFTRQPFADVNTLTTNTHDKKFVEKLINIIEERITDPQLSVEELSREMAMSRSSLHKKLKAMSGHVPNEFIRLIRLKNAAKLLLSGEHNISEVGYLTGFNSPSYFSKCFMQQFNLTPSEFAEKHAGKSNIIIDDITG